MSRFSENVDAMLERQERRAAQLAADVAAFVVPAGDERAVDVGTGTGALAFALAPLVASVVGVDPEEALLDRARERAPANATFVAGNAERLPFEDASFDLAGTLRTLHHVRRPELAVAELARVTIPGGRVLVIDQLAPLDPLEALAMDRFEKARSDDHERLLGDQELRSLFDANRLALVRERRAVEQRNPDDFLTAAGCEGEARRAAEALAPRGREPFPVEIGWYLLRRL